MYGPGGTAGAAVTYAVFHGCVRAVCATLKAEKLCYGWLSGQGLLAVIGWGHVRPSNHCWIING